MDVKYLRDMNHNYMIVRCGENLREESFETRMIFANKIPGLLPCHIRYIDDESYLGYDVTSRQSLSFFCENRKPGKKEMQNILGSIFRNISVLEEYLLCPDHLILDPQFILVNFDTQDAELAFAPFFKKDIRASLREVVEYLLTFMAHDDRQGIVLGYRLSHELLEGSTGISRLNDILYEKNEAEVPVPKSFVYGNGNDEKAREAGQEPDIGSPYAGTFDSEEPDHPDSHEGSHLLSSLNMSERRTKEAFEGRGRKSFRKALFILICGFAAAAALYFILNWVPIIFSETVDMIVRIGLAAVVCCVAIFAALRMKKKEVSLSAISGECEPEFENGADNSDLKEERMDEKADLWGDRYSDTDFMTDSVNTGEDLTILLTEGPGGGGCTSALVPEDADSDLPVLTLSSHEEVIGKHMGIVSQMIDSPAVSRIHARIRRGDDGYYLRDLNSTNGTTVNGKQVFGEEEILLKEGDRVTFADAVYIFRG